MTALLFVLALWGMLIPFWIMWRAWRKSNNPDMQREPTGPIFTDEQQREAVERMKETEWTPFFRGEPEGWKRP